MRLKHLFEAIAVSDYREYVKNWDRTKYIDLFKQSNWNHDNQYFRIYKEFELDNDNVVPTPDDIQQHLNDSGYSDIDYVNGIAKDKYSRDVKIGRLLRDEPDLLKKFNTDPKRARYRNKQKHIIIISRHPADIAAMSTNQTWKSCMNLHTGQFSYMVKDEIKNGSIVAYELIQEDPVMLSQEQGSEIKQVSYRLKLDNKTILGVAIGRILIKAYHNDDETAIAFGECGTNYGFGTSHIFKETVTDWIRWANDKFDIRSFVSYKLPSGSYDDGVSEISGNNDMSLDDFDELDPSEYENSNGSAKNILLYMEYNDLLDEESIEKWKNVLINTNVEYFVEALIKNYIIEDLILPEEIQHWIIDDYVAIGLYWSVAKDMITDKQYLIDVAIKSSSYNNGDGEYQIYFDIIVEIFISQLNEEHTINYIILDYILTENEEAIKEYNINLAIEPELDYTLIKLLLNNDIDGYDMVQYVMSTEPSDDDIDKFFDFINKKAGLSSIYNIYENLKEESDIVHSSKYSGISLKNTQVEEKMHDIISHSSMHEEVNNYYFTNYSDKDFPKEYIDRISEIINSGFNSKTVISSFIHQMTLMPSPTKREYFENMLISGDNKDEIRDIYVEYLKLSKNITMKDVKPYLKMFTSFDDKSFLLSNVLLNKIQYNHGGNVDGGLLDYIISNVSEKSNLLLTYMQKHLITKRLYNLEKYLLVPSDQIEMHVFDYQKILKKHIPEFDKYISNDNYKQSLSELEDYIE